MGWGMGGSSCVSVANGGELALNGVSYIRFRVSTKQIE